MFYLDVVRLLSCPGRKAGQHVGRVLLVGVSYGQHRQSPILASWTPVKIHNLIALLHVDSTGLLYSTVCM